MRQFTSNGAEFQARPKGVIGPYEEFWARFETRIGWLFRM